MSLGEGNGRVRLVKGGGQRFSFCWQRFLGLSLPPFIPFLRDSKLSWGRLQVTSTGGWLEVQSSLILLTWVKIMWIWCLGVLFWVEQTNYLYATEWQYRLLPLLLPVAGIEYTGDGWEVSRDGNHILCTRGVWLVSEVFRHLPVTALDMNCVHVLLHSPSESSPDTRVKAFRTEWDLNKVQWLLGVRRIMWGRNYSTG